MKKGIVIKSTGSRYTVRDEDGNMLDCIIAGKFRMKGLKTTNPVAVGDLVKVKPGESGQHHTIAEIEPRKNYIIRRSSNLSHQYHILASNIDQALLIITIGFPDTTTAFIDRFLVSAEAYRIPVVLIFNKADMYDNELGEEIKNLMGIYENIGYQCLQTSARNGTGIDEMKNILKDKVSVIAGHSGVGKSTLINKISPGLNLKTGKISDYHMKGKHTTTFAEMFELSFGGFIIDTPGIKGFGVIDMEKEEIFHFFPEIFRVAENCQYYNCTHIHEPGCAVKDAVEKEEISYSRYYNYVGLVTNSDDKYRNKDY